MFFYILLALVVAAIAFSIVRNVRGGEDWEDVAIYAAVTTVFSACVAALIFCILLLTPLQPHSKLVKTTTATHPLASLGHQTGAHVDAEFFLGGAVISGSTNVQYTYMYAAKDQNGATYYQQATADSGSSNIYESDDKQPSVTETDWTFDVSSGILAPFSFGTETGNHYDFTIPKGSIKTDYQPN